MKELIKAFPNGQWTMDETLEKARIDTGNNSGVKRYDRAARSGKHSDTLVSPRMSMRPRSATHMEVTHGGKKMIMPDHEAHAYAEKHLGPTPSGTPTMVSHARETGMSHSSGIGAHPQPKLP